MVKFRLPALHIVPGDGSTGLRVLLLHPGSGRKCALLSGTYRSKFWMKEIASNFLKIYRAFASNFVKNIPVNRTTALVLSARFYLKGGGTAAGDNGTRVMFFLLRMAFWLAVVCVLLPSGSKTAAPSEQVNTAQAVTAASAAVSDMQGFCARQPNACVIGGKIAVAITQKAEAGARTLYQFLTTKVAQQTPSANKQVPAPVDGQQTLTKADLLPPWHATVPLPPRRQARVGTPSV